MIKSKKILLVTWSHVNLAFIDILKSNPNNEVKIIRFEHEEGWNTKSRSYIKNYIHIIKFILMILGKSIGKDCIYFGHNLCRVFFLFSFLNKSSFYIFNELPRLDKSIVCILDMLIFKFSKRNFISSESRRDLLKLKGFYTKNTKILENVSFKEIQINLNKDKNNKAIIMGTFSRKRFGELSIDEINKLKNTPLDIDALPSFVDRDFKKDLINVNWLKTVPHCEVDDVIKTYSYGILAYEGNSENNFHAAPLKIYEYVNMGLKIISLLPNKGINAIKKEYPELFVDQEFNIKNSNNNNEGYKSARLNFLKNAIETNQQFANIVESA